MTSHWCDFQNTDVILNCGSNSVENHPVSALWLEKAHEQGAKWIVVDPRYTRTAEQADIWCPIRSGTDIAFYGGMYNYIIEHLIEPNLAKYQETGDMSEYNFEYLLNYTNASYILDPDYKFDPETGLFSGWNEKTKTYNVHSWHYETESTEDWDTSENGAYAWVNKPGTPEFTTPTLTNPKKDMTLQDPMCVYQQFKKHYSRYTLDTVCGICGMDKDVLELVYKTYTSTAKPGKAGTVLYALGQTQHTYGAQNTRAMCVMQLLLGNIGIPGGGVNALRGEPNVQGATDIGMMVNEHPAYLKWANTTDRASLRKWLESQTYSDGYYTNKPKFIVSSLKEWFGENATVDNDYGYDWWPKVPSETGAVDYTHISTFELMQQGVIKGYFNWGMNPCHSAPNAGNVRRSMANLDWLVVADQVITESASFWNAPDMNPSEIDTTVYYLPCALIYEKPGIILNSGRWIQYRYQAVEPWDQAKPDYEMCDLLWTAICDLYKKEGGANPDPILKTKWDYYVDGKIDPRPVAWALNGYRIAGTECNTDSANPKTDLLKGYAELGADGSTACAMWIYSDMWNNNDAPLGRAAAVPPQHRGQVRHRPELRVGVQLAEQPPHPVQPQQLRHAGQALERGQEAHGMERREVDPGRPGRLRCRQGRQAGPAFFMLWEQNARLESYGMVDGPLPEHFEPFESPCDENPLNGAFHNPCAFGTQYASTKQGTKEQYSIVATTYSVTEHWQTGGQTRLCPALVESMPAQFVEMSEEFAAEKGIKNGDEVRVFNNRGSVVVPALVTKRLQPMNVNGKVQHQVGLTHHFGWADLYGTGDVVNDLTPNVGDPNSFTPEYKAFLVDIEKA